MGDGAVIEADLERLLEFLKTERGFDFTGYKRASLSRRIERRMHAVEAPDYARYLDHLQVDPGEFETLFNTVLINVTGFFRDEPAWDYVGREVLPALIAGKADDAPIRVWCAACATGEEAYSIAMLLAEALGEDALRARVKIYATDLDEEALTAARAAAYAPRALEGVAPERVERFFERANGRLVFRHDLRRTVIFGRHDLVQDAPISRVDLLICRNVLMYFNADTQARILANFQFALGADGYLFLGKSEVLLSRVSPFVPFDLRARVFRKDLVPAVPEPADVVVPATTDGDGDGLLAAAFELAPLATLLVDRAGVLQHANQRAVALFGLRPADVGRPLQDLEFSYRPIELRSRIDESNAESRIVTVRDAEWVTDHGRRFFDVQVIPLSWPGDGLAGVAVVFSDVSRARALQDDLESSRRELETAHEELQSTVEELETTNEELQSSNEELETTNEELQSANEELETMNEELQATNEELETINDEFRERTEQLNHLNGFLEHILASLRSAVIVVDRDLRVDVWNARAADLWGLRAEEVHGSNLLGLDIGLPVDRLTPALRACLTGDDGVHELRIEARNRRGREIVCAVKATPLRGQGQAVTGVILLMDEEPEPAL